jgi:hypothetical protein
MLSNSSCANAADHSFCVSGTPESSNNDEEEPPSNKPPQGRNDPTQGLTVIRQRQLLIDILARGGINAFSLQALCNLKPDIYGAPASEQRQKTQNLLSLNFSSLG